MSVKAKKIFNLTVKRGDDGGKHLDVQMHGVIDGGWMDEGDNIDTSDIISKLNEHRDAKTVGVRINSIGGSAMGGVAMYNALNAHPGEVTCTVEGLAASAASLVAMAGKTVMGKGAMMMIHSPSLATMGNASELRKTADLLDKVQDALAGIYVAKTGKSKDEINDLLDDETWMTADEAKAAGFADETMPDVKTDYGPGEEVPAEQDDETANDAAPGQHGKPTNDDGDDDAEDVVTADDDDDDDDSDGEEGEDDDGAEQDRAPRLTTDGLAVRWAGVSFPVARLPGQIVLMAKPPKAVPTPHLAAVPRAPVVAELPLERADLERRNPTLLAALMADGYKAGVAAERARLKEIDDLGVKGCADLVAEAKYGARATDAAGLAVAIVKGGQAAGADLLAVRRQESKTLAAVTVGAPDQSEASAEARTINAITAGVNSRRGGK